MLKTFFEITKILNREFDETPVLYGSFGLGRVIEKDFDPDDVDVLVSDEFVHTKCKDLRRVLEENGYTLRDEKEHEFIKNGVKLAFASVLDLKNLIGSTRQDLEITDESSVRFYELLPKHYLNLYQYLEADAYRHKLGKTKKDKEKLEAILDYELRHKIS